MMLMLINFLCLDIFWLFIIYTLLVWCYIKFYYKYYRLYDIWDFDYNYKYNSTSYLIKVYNKCKLDEYVHLMWTALNSIKQWNNCESRIIDIRLIEWDNGTKIYISRVFEIDNTVNYDLFVDTIKDVISHIPNFGIVTLKLLLFYYI